MSIDGMEELTRDEFQAAAEQLERMSIDQFEQLSAEQAQYHAL